MIYVSGLHELPMNYRSSSSRVFAKHRRDGASLDGRARGCASGVSMRVILSHLGSPDNLAFMYSPIVLTLTEGFARGGAHVVYGSTGERNGTRDRWTQQTLSEELCAALIAGQSPTFHSSRRATASRESIHLWRPAQAAAAARRRVRVAGTLAVPNTSGHFNYY